MHRERPVQALNRSGREERGCLQCPPCSRVSLATPTTNFHLTHHASRTHCNLIRCLEIKTADSAQPRKRSIVTRPFPLQRAGSGYETNLHTNPLGSVRVKGQGLASRINPDRNPPCKRSFRGAHVSMYWLRQFVVVYKHVTMTSLLWLRTPTHPKRFDIKLWVSNEKKNFACPITTITMAKINDNNK